MDPNRLRWLLLGVAVLVSAVLVVGAFHPAPHSGGDNSGYLSLAFALLTTGSYAEVFDPARLPHVKYPPVFPGMLAILMWLGARTWAAFKAVAAVSTVVAVGLTYLWAERRLGPWPAFTVAVLVGTSSAVLYHSHWVLSDPVFLAFTMAALWALEREGEEGWAEPAWLAAGVLAAGLAYFTRSAGIPLVAAIIVWLALRKRWLPLSVTAVVVGVPGAVWWARGSGVPTSYANEFWLVDPYQPALGTIGVLDLFPRAASNLSAYVLGHAPIGIVGSQVSWVPLLGVVLAVAALYGWVRQMRERVGPAELFLPAYTALILVWPEVWSGDRFVLPLYPLVFAYGAVAIRDAGRRLPAPGDRVVVAAALLVLLLPAGASWAREAGLARECARITRSVGAFSCYGPGVGAFVDAASWADGSLPDSAVVLSRKPRHFYLLSGIPSRTFPFVDDPDALLREADAVGARYVLLDEWDRLAGFYVGGAVVQRPLAFCFVRSFGEAGVAEARLLGILPPGQRGSSSAAPSDQVRLRACPPDYVGVNDSSPSWSSSSDRVPLLERLDP